MEVSIPEGVRREIAGVVREAGGAEVLFAGRIGPGGALREVHVLARGNPRAAPAILRDLEGWQVLLHNHPGGDLTPSDADVAVASEVGARGIGFLIVDDEARRVRAVVEPFPPREISPLDPGEIEAFFAPDGPLSEGFPGYEPRPGQVEMAREAARAMNEDGVAAIEAGTGIGKSFAYLVPAILWAARNRERVVVSTNTIHLQEQLIGKDLPALAGIIGRWGALGDADPPFAFALIKGRGNYICLRRALEVLDAGPSLFDGEEEKALLEDLARWTEATRDGSRSDLAVVPPSSTWEKVRSESDRCLRVNCRHYTRCFYFRAKRRAFRAHILVVNHHLFFADLAVRRALDNPTLDLVLPGYERVIFDEAHNLEKVASEYFGTGISRIGLAQRLGRLVSAKDPEKGALPYLIARLRKLGARAAARAVETGYRDVVGDVRRRIEDAFDGIGGAIEGERARQAAEERPGGREERFRLDGRPGGEPFWREVFARIGAIREAAVDLWRRNDAAAARVRDVPALPGDRLRSLLVDLVSTGARLEAVVEAIDFFLDREDRGHVRWVERSGGRSRENVACRTAPILVAEDLRAGVFDPARSVILTSATLAVEGRIDFLARRLGLDGIPRDRFAFRAIPSGFDYAEQARLLVPDDVPEPGAAGYEDAIRAWIGEALARTGGRAFVLFTSYTLLRRIYEALAPALRAQGIDPMRQGEAPRGRLLARFRRGGKGALFGTDSFWEGVDVRGEALTCVIITRLPFRVPSDPVQVARIEEIEARGENAFLTYSVPQAVLRLKQGFGRLIRSRADRGVVAILDRRIVSRTYGRAFLQSLPPAPVVRGSGARALEELERFLDG